MTKTEFIALCFKYLVDPTLALENEELKNALKTRQDAVVENILQNSF